MQVQLGRYQTRLNRIVEINSSRWIDEKQENGTTAKKRIWSGLLLKADGITPDSNYEWEDDGRLRNSRGVNSYHDLATLIQGRGGAEPASSDSSIVETLELRERVQRLTIERDNWQGTAEQAMRNTQFYRDLVVQIGEKFSVAARTTCDDGSVLCAKVPDLVDDAVTLLKRVRSAPKHAYELSDEITALLGDDASQAGQPDGTTAGQTVTA